MGTSYNHCYALLISKWSRIIIAGCLIIFLALTPSQVSSQISDSQKRDFFELLKTLPHKGEFFTDESIDKAGGYLPIIFALTEKDIEKLDIYPFLALSRGLCDRKAHRDYAVRHFAEIQHPILKLGWGLMLFDAGATSPQIVQFLRTALGSEKQSKILSEILGPEFEDFRRRVISYPNTKR